MKLFGLIGYPLSHSFSSTYFSNKFESEGILDCEYRLFPIDHISKITNILAENNDLVGFNVTIPYKKKIIPFLTKIDSNALAVGAVNTVKVIRNQGKIELHGYNTDILGFEQSLLPLLTNKRVALILGTGGGASAVAYVLKRLEIPILFVSRVANRNAIDYSQISDALLDETSIIVNTTPCGMFPNVNESPLLPYSKLNSNHILYDLIYNPEETQFLKNGKVQGCKTKNGLEMLQIQAEEAWKICNK